MLQRLEGALKDFFQLRKMEIPGDESRLIWSLPRFLSSAAKKVMSGKIIVIIDGVDNLRGFDSPEGSLHWLPVELPEGVRLILSTTINAWNLVEGLDVNSISGGQNGVKTIRDSTSEDHYGDDFEDDSEKEAEKTKPQPHRTYQELQVGTFKL